jgi:hypothetical protein
MSSSLIIGASLLLPGEEADMTCADAMLTVVVLFPCDILNVFAVALVMKSKCPSVLLLLGNDGSFFFLLSWIAVMVILLLFEAGSRGIHVVTLLPRGIIISHVSEVAALVVMKSVI